MPGFPGSSLGSGGWGLRCQELMRSSFYFILFYFILFSYVFDFIGLLGFSPCIYIYVYIHSGIYINIYFLLPFCAAPSLSPPWLTLSVRWGDTCAFGCLVSWGVGAGVRRGRFVWDFAACLSWLEEINHSMLGTRLSFSLAFLPGLSCPLILFSLIFLFYFAIVIAIVVFFFFFLFCDGTSTIFFPLFFFLSPLVVSMLVLPSFVPSSWCVWPWLWVAPGRGPWRRLGSWCWCGRL